MSRGRKKQPPTSPERRDDRPIYTAAVRYRDGTYELIRVKYANDLEDARAVLFDQLMNVQTVVIAAL
ncbi:MAG: hypothetical protein PHT48_04930 [Dechloromonas sp.]|nr:hypothetical protein [Dechloromonas sp.]